jgi:hypothetical protein
MSLKRRLRDVTERSFRDYLDDRDKPARKSGWEQLRYVYGTKINDGAMRDCASADERRCAAGPRPTAKPDMIKVRIMIIVIRTRAL